ncbi:MAG: hypothetical protein LBL75_01625 [Rickettsiales bacterium]|jgi:hypothetical protein|nr:hypothetical protein [Rickettsiales bacterium]
MDNIATLRLKLAACEAQEDIRAQARVPSGVIIDLNSSDGNIYYIMGLCQRLAQDNKLPQADYEQFQKELKRLRKYDERLTLCQRWFGLIYLNK